MHSVRNLCNLFKKENSSLQRRTVHNRIPSRNAAATKTAKKTEKDAKPGKRSRPGEETAAAAAKRTYKALDHDEHNWPDLLIQITAPPPPFVLPPDQVEKQKSLKKIYEENDQIFEDRLSEMIIAMTKRRDLAAKALPAAFIPAATRTIKEEEMFDESYWEIRNENEVHGPEEYPPPKKNQPKEKVIFESEPEEEVPSEEVPPQEVSSQAQ